MSNIFDDVLKNVNNVERKYLGPTYPYYKNIKTPSEIGMSDRGTLDALAKDINGLIQYVEVLVSGRGASRTGAPLGNKFFLETGAKCIDKKTGNEVNRHIYINNVPSGNIPIISSGLGVNFREFKGLIPGTLGNLNVLNPAALLRAFLSGSKPECQQLTMETIDENNIKSSATHYVATVDINNMDPCIFKNKTNPATGGKCRETFSNGSYNEYNNNLYNINYNINDDTFFDTIINDPLTNVYFASLTGIGIYILYKLINK